ncbi:MAG: peptidoglycan-binding protein [Eggerthellaceae bacterium]|nr:peptidoglycan-binding protein [Eggerthellaceae bacterium]
MQTIRMGQSGPAVEDVQTRLMIAGALRPEAVSSTFDEQTLKALHEFCMENNIPVTDEVNEKVWTTLVDASFELGDRTLYLRMPYFHGRDVLILQRVLGALGFAFGEEDGIFGASTELALRKFQMSMGLPSDGIAGAMTYHALKNLQHSWFGKERAHTPLQMGFARAANVLESHALCLFGTDTFTRDVASRISNLALATNPASKIVSAEALSVKPNQSMLLVHVVINDLEDTSNVPSVDCTDEITLALRLRTAIAAANNGRHPPRIKVVLPGFQWEDAGSDRSAQHFAIMILDALCAALDEESL